MTFDPAEELKTLLNTKWNTEIEKPEIIRTIEHRSYNVIDKDVIMIGQTMETDEPFGIGGRDYKRNIIMLITVKTTKSYERMQEMAEEVRRILRTPENWSPFHFFIMTNKVDLSQREAKIYSSTFDVLAYRFERLE